MADLTPSERTEARRIWDTLDTWAQSYEPRLAAAIRGAIDRLRHTLTDADAVKIVETGDLDALISRIDWTTIQHELRRVVVEAATEAPTGFLVPGARSAVGPMPTTVQVRFNILNDYSVMALRDYESRAIAILQDDVRAGAIEWLSVGLQRGWNPVQTARGLRGIIGLPTNLVRAASNYERALLTGDRSALERALRDKRSDSTVRAAIESSRGVDPVRAARLVDAYTARALRMNAETIARTASMDAVVMGQRLTWKQAISEGKLQEDQLRRFWIIARDERVCARCESIPVLNPDGRNMDEPFITPMDGLVLQPTLHYRCRCIIFYKFVEAD